MPNSYIPVDIIDFFNLVAKLGPFGASGKDFDHPTIQNGTCAIDSAHYDDADIMRLGQCTLDIFNWSVQGHFMWTVRNELEPRWNYIDSYDKGWIVNAPQPEDFTQQ